MLPFVVVVVALAGCARGAAVEPAANVGAAKLRAQAERSVALLQRVGAQWKTPCFSCHHQAMPALALEAARARGIRVDENAARQASQRAFRFLASLDDAVQVNMLIDPALSEGYALVAAQAAGVKPSLSTAAYARHIARFQRADGHWPTFDGRPPHSAGEFVATAIAARAISHYLPARAAEEKRERLERARAWLGKAQPASTEDLTYRLLGLAWTGGAESERARAARELAAIQREDGGWSQVPSLKESDAYSTAQALVALRRAGGMATDDPAFVRGIAWLSAAQAADGSWRVKTRIHSKAPVSPPYFESGFPYGHDQYVSCAATGWGVMALAEALPPGPAAAAPRQPLPLTGVAPESTAPWMETALFGTADEVAKLDPKLATAQGTTVLMMVADRADKVRALLANGARATATAVTGVDALMVASLYPGNYGAVESLLEAGAAAQARAGVKFSAAPLPLAVSTGDREMVRLLVARGADPNAPMKLLGAFPAPPLMLAAGFDDAPMITLLAAKGAQIEAADEKGMTALSWSALNHKDAAVRALVDLGANAKVKDSFGLTPLDHTAAISHSSPDAGRMLANRN